MDTPQFPILGAEAVDASVVVGSGLLCEPPLVDDAFVVAGATGLLVSFCVGGG